MKITVNGEMHELPDGLTIAAVAQQLGLNPLSVAIERNGQIVPRSQQGSTPTHNGDAIEIVEFIGGG